MTIDPFALAKEKFDLAAWVKRHGFDPQGRRKQEWVQDCPFCGGDRKLSVNVRARAWRCFVCRRRMSLTDLVAAFEGSYERAVQVILHGSGLRPGALDHIPDDATADDVDDRPWDWEPEPIPPPSGLVPAFEHPYVLRRRFDPGLMAALGVMLCTEGRYQDRLIFPVRRPDGHWIYFQSRATWEKHQQPAGRRYVKNLNPSNVDPSRYASSADVLLGLDLVIQNRMTWAVLVEGPTDWLGYGPPAVATFGKVLSDRQLGLLARAGISTIFLAYDPDAWIRTSPHRPAPAQSAADRLSAIFDVRVVRYPDGTDPGDYTPSQNAEHLAAAVPYGDGGRLAYLP